MAKKQKQTKEKPLEKFTAIELRDMAKKIEGVTGTSGMNKSELISAIKASKGITEEKKAADTTTRQSKAKIRELKKQRETLLQENDHKMADIARRRISRLKKKTRRAAI